MKTFSLLLAVVLLGLANQATAQSRNWIGYAAAPDGRYVEIIGGTESSARNTALAECERQTVRSCNAISVQPRTNVVIISCRFEGRQESFLGGSNINIGGARWLANNKAKNAGFYVGYDGVNWFDSDNDCIEVFRYVSR